MTPKRRSFTAADKAAAVWKHLIDKGPVSQFADQMNVQPTMIHHWIKTAMAQAERAFETTKAAKSEPPKHDQQLAAYREKLIAKNEVIAEVMEENIRSKKASGEP